MIYTVKKEANEIGAFLPHINIAEICYIHEAVTIICNLLRTIGSMLFLKASINKTCIGSISRPFHPPIGAILYRTL